jgi:hypothetical protein
MSGQLQATAALPPEKEPPPRSDWKECWVGPRTGLGYIEKGKILDPTEIRTLSPPVTDQEISSTETVGLLSPP